MSYNLCEYFGSIELMTPQVLDPGIPLYVGLECEIESIANHMHGADLFHVTNDGSLRNNGLEFITSPIPIDSAVPYFKKLHASLKFRNDAEKFSPRTSIHVHANCANLHPDVIRNIIRMYALYEEYFFMMVTPDRRHNIHCVPLTETYLPSLYNTGLNMLVSRWHKYTALNIVPLKKYGTIEFRHMQGHDNPILLDYWLRTINNLFEVSKRHPIDKATLTDENLLLWFQSIFKDSGLDLNYHRVHIKTTTFNSLLDLKTAVM